MASTRWLCFLATTLLLSALASLSADARSHRVDDGHNIARRDSNWDYGKRFNDDDDMLNSSDYVNDEDDETLNDEDGEEKGDSEEEDDDESPYGENTIKPITVHKEIIFSTGDTVWLPCMNSRPEASIVWSRNNETMFINSYAMKNDKDLFRYDNSTISVSNMNEDDIGVYVCNVTSGNRTVTIYNLNMMSAPTVEMYPKRREDQFVVENNAIKIECRATGNPKPTIKWSHESEVVREEDAEIGDQYIFIEHAQRRNTGMYQCLAENGVGAPAHGSVYIKVLYAPKIHAKKTVVNTDEGYEAQLLCVVHSDPRAIITWMKGNTKIHRSSKYLINEDGQHSTLVVKNVIPKDFGDYFCNATNRYGSSLGHVQLVKQPGRALWKSGSQDNNNGAPIVQWAVESVQPLTDIELKYYKIDETIPNHVAEEEEWIVVKPEINNPENNNYLITHKFQNLHPGKYGVKVRTQNAHGWGEFSEPHIFDGDYESNEIRAEDSLVEEAPLAEVAAGSSWSLQPISLAYTISSTLTTLCLIRLL